LFTFESEFSTLVADLWALNKSVNDPGLRRRLGKELTGNVPKFTNVAPNPTATPLWAEGFIPIGPLAGRLNVPEVLAQLSNCRLYNVRDVNYQAPPAKNEFLLNERPSNVFLAGFKFEDLIRCTALLKLACDPAIVDAVRSCIGCTPTISGFQAWYAFPGQSDIAAEMFHRDLDDFNFVKLFVYLTDVGPEDGPHQFIPYSHRVESLQQYFRSNGKNVDLRPLFQGNSRGLVTADVEKLFGQDIMTVTGPAGFAFLEDTYGLHRETRPSGSARLIFSALYTGLPLRYADESVRTYEMSRSMSFSEAGLGTPSDVERYMLRYYLSDTVQA
jgi:hypothetical protein